MKPIERLIIRKRNALLKRGKTLFMNAIREQYQQALSAMDATLKKDGLSSLPGEIKKAITTVPIDGAFKTYYGSASDIAVTWRKHLLPNESNDVYKAVFERYLMKYARTKAGSRIVNITGTTYENIIGVVESATTQALSEGLSVAGTRDLIIKYIRDDYSQFTKARANLIAQTEINTAANAASMEAGRSTGLETRKLWSTSGLANVRDSHMACEQESIASGGLMENETFSNGLSYPGDPAGEAAETVNCRCCILIEIV